MLKFLPGFFKSKSDAQLKKSLKILLGFSPANISLYKQAFLHSSKRETVNNERLEFLGDAVLEIAVTEYLFNEYPDTPEGDLTNWRASLVNAKILSKIASEIDLEKYLYLSKGESKDKNSKARLYILANAIEALIGACRRGGAVLVRGDGIERAADLVGHTAGRKVDAGRGIEILAHHLLEDDASKTLLLRRRHRGSAPLQPAKETAVGFDPLLKAAADGSFVEQRSPNRLERAVGKSAIGM